MESIHVNSDLSSMECNSIQYCDLKCHGINISTECGINNELEMNLIII